MRRRRGRTGVRWRAGRLDNRDRMAFLSWVLKVNQWLLEVETIFAWRDVLCKVLDGPSSMFTVDEQGSK